MYAALAYFYDHHAALVAAMHATAAEADRLRPGATLSRAELLGRKS